MKINSKWALLVVALTSLPFMGSICVRKIDPVFFQEIPPVADGVELGIITLTFPTSLFVPTGRIRFKGQLTPLVNGVLYLLASRSSCGTGTRLEIYLEGGLMI